MGISLANYEESVPLCRADFDLPGAAPIFRDHFPGRPLLPAIGLLYLCDWTLRRWLGADVRIVALRRVKFTNPVQPEVRLQIELTQVDSQRLGLVARSGSVQHCSGELHIHSASRREAELS
jgi:3-hydroxymyristoyl/3-hydroxydecanoyl-(acyl carrier protein) dehydratase